MPSRPTVRLAPAQRSATLQIETELHHQNSGFRLEESRLRNYRVDYKTGNDYFLIVQYHKDGAPAIHNLIDLKQIPLRAPNLKEPTTLDAVVKLEPVTSPSEIDHYQIHRMADVYVTPKGQDLAKLASAIRGVVANANLGPNIRVHLRGMVEGMDASFRSFAIGFGLSFVLLLLILVECIIVRETL